MDMHRKLNHLVPVPDCDTRGDVIEVWRDARPQPSYEDIFAVDIADVEVAEEERETELLRFIDPTLRLARITFKQENRLRSLEGRQPILWKQFARKIRNERG